MASLNWTMLSQASPPSPITLPGEKIVLTQPGVALSLTRLAQGQPTSLAPVPVSKSSSSKPSKKDLSANGRVFLSNKRVIFVADTAKPGGGGGANPSSQQQHGGAVPPPETPYYQQPATAVSSRGSLASGSASIVHPSSEPAQPRASITTGGAVAPQSATAAEQAQEQDERVPQKIESLSVPWQRFLDGRYVQPWFSSPHYEAMLVPARGGGLGSDNWLARFAFKESGGYDFYEVVEEMKARVAASADSSAAPEPLPMYEPPSGTPSLPSEDIEAANVAREAERLEDGRCVPRSSLDSHRSNSLPAASAAGPDHHGLVAGGANTTDSPPSIDGLSPSSNAAHEPRRAQGRHSQGSTPPEPEEGESPPRYEA